MPNLAAAAFLLQDQASLANDVHWIMIAVVAIALCILLVFLAFAVAGILVLKEVRSIQAKVESLTDNVTKTAMPMVHKASALFDHLDPKIRSVADDLAPRIKSIAADAEHISAVVRSKVDDAGESFSEINTTVKDANLKTHAQVARVNGIVTHAITATEEITHTVTEGIRKPVRKIAETVSAVLAGVEDISGKLPGLLSGILTKVTRPKPAPVRETVVRTEVVAVPIPVPVADPTTEL